MPSASERRHDRLPRAWLALVLAALATAALVLPVSAQQNGGGEGGDAAPVPPEELVVPPGFEVRALVSQLDFPTAITWDDEGTAYVATAGFVYGVNHTYPAQVMRLGADGRLDVIADGFDPPLTDITWHDGVIYVSERGQITRLVEQGGNWTKEVVVSDLPAFGDHHTNEVVVGPDGRLYFGQGPPTNSAVVGLDNLLMGWEENITAGSDVPCEDIVLRGWNYVTDNPWEGDRIIHHFQRAPTVVYESEADIPPEAKGVNGSNVTTGIYVPFGTPTYRGQVIPGQVPCGGAILSVDPDGTGMDWVAWGLRNVFGVKFDANGQLWASENMYDTRGSRPIAGCPDHFWRIEPGTWYGWPDYCGGVPVNQTAFSLPNETGVPQRVLLRNPTDAPVPSPVLNVTHHASADKFDFAPGEPWGNSSMVYMAQFGDMTPMTGMPGHHSGMAVVRFDADDPKEPEIFLAAKERFGGDFRPVEAVFGPDGNLYVVHIGAVPMKEAPDPAPPGSPVPAAPFPMAGTGAVYVLSASQNATQQPSPGAEATPTPPGGGGAISPSPSPSPADGGQGTPVGEQPPEEAEGDEADVPLPAWLAVAAAACAGRLAGRWRRD